MMFSSTGDGVLSRHCDGRSFSHERYNASRCLVSYGRSRPVSDMESRCLLWATAPHSVTMTRAVRCSSSPRRRSILGGARTSVRPSRQANGPCQWRRVRLLTPGCVVGMGTVPVAANRELRYSYVVFSGSRLARQETLVRKVLIKRSNQVRRARPGCGLSACG